ncbi:MAG: amidohydrolase family protein [Desulfobacterales bacterium]|nr:amidohydrolase family protein [Desulfobacterales bacterium]
MTTSHHAESKRVRAGWLVDGRGGPALKDVCLVLRAGQILAVEPYRDDHRPIVDLSQATVLPALMDAHVHLVFSGTEDVQARKAQLTFAPEQVRAAIRTHLQAHWQCGVAAVRDGGDRHGITLAFRQGNSDTAAALTVKAAGPAWHLQGRYGAMIGRALPTDRPPAQAIASSLAAGDHLKLIQSGLNSIDQFGHQGPPLFSQDQLQAMVAAAHAAGRPVMVHANGESAVRMALAAGCDSIEHGYFMGPENLRRMAEMGIVWVPTLIPMAALSQAEGLTVAQRDVARRTTEHQLAQVRQAQALGVVMALGTDAGSQGVDHGAAVRRELQLLVMAGLRMEAAIACATGHAARLLGMVERGELVTGRRADFIAVNGPPENLVEALGTIEAMCIAGRWVRP